MIARLAKLIWGSFITAVCLLSCTGSNPSSDTAMMQGNCSRTGVLNTKPLKQLNGLAWRRDAVASPLSSPIAVNGKVFVHSTNGALLCLDASDGQDIWRNNARVKYMIPAISDELLICASNYDSTVFALKTTDGSELWRVKLSSIAPDTNYAKDSLDWILSSRPSFTSPAIVGDKLCFSDFSSVYCMNVRTGDLIWSVVASFIGGVSCVAISDSTIVLSERQEVLALYVSSGRRKWKTSIVDELGSESLCNRLVAPVVDNGRVFVSVPRGEEGVICFEEDSGTIRWRFRSENDVQSMPAVTNEMVLAGDYGGVLYALDSRRGELKWRTNIGQSMRSSPTIAGNIVYVCTADDSSGVYALDVHSGEQLWHFVSEHEIIATPAVSDGMLYFVDSRGNLVALK